MHLVDTCYLMCLDVSSRGSRGPEAFYYEAAVPTETPIDRTTVHCSCCGSNHKRESTRDKARNMTKCTVAVMFVEHGGGRQLRSVIRLAEAWCKVSWYVALQMLVLLQVMQRWERYCSSKAQWAPDESTFPACSATGCYVASSTTRPGVVITLCSAKITCAARSY
jgi:hypothetical protein